LSAVDATDEWAFSQFPVCDNASNSTGVALAKAAVDTISVKLAELQFTAVDVNGIRCKALIDGTGPPFIGSPIYRVRHS